MSPRPDANSRRIQSMLKAHREGRLAVRSKLSDLEMATMLHGGSTLEEIASVAGVTRERVRQRLQRIGVTTASRVDVVKLLEVIRTKPVSTFGAAAKASGMDSAAAHHAIYKLELSDAVERLFRLRKRAQVRARQQDLIISLQVLAQRLGRTPSANDLIRGDRAAGVPSLGTVQQQFGSLSAAMSAAGLQPNAVGRRAK